MSLSKRIKKIADLYDGEEIVWDVCCDHGKIGKAFFEHREVAEVHFVDIVPHLIDKLRKDTYIPWATPHFHAKPAENITPIKNKKNLIIITGIGGHNLIRIFEEWKKRDIGNKHEQFIVSPHQHLHIFKSYLKKNKWKITHETVVQDGKRYYEILKINKTKGGEIHPYGNLLWEKGHGDYLNTLINKIKGLPSTKEREEIISYLISKKVAYNKKKRIIGEQ